MHNRFILQGSAIGTLTIAGENSFVTKENGRNETTLNLKAEGKTNCCQGYYHNTRHDQDPLPDKSLLESIASD